MKTAVIQFPGSNCDWDTFYVLRDVLGVPAEMVFHKEESLGGADAVIIPGGFSYGDYLRCGAIARFSPVMKALAKFAAGGGPVLGICNGFQILCEAQLLPGALIRNGCLEFRCLTCDLAVEDSSAFFNREHLGGHLRLPIAHGEGNYRIDPAGLEELKRNRQILLRYAAPAGNPNGSMDNIAGVRNREGNVFGMMPHPERAAERFHPSLDGLAVLQAFLPSRPLARAS